MTAQAAMPFHVILHCMKLMAKETEICTNKIQKNSHNNEKDKMKEKRLATICKKCYTYLMNRKRYRYRYRDRFQKAFCEKLFGIK